jgi:hypothetical protein
MLTGIAGQFKLAAATTPGHGHNSHDSLTSGATPIYPLEGSLCYPASDTHSGYVYSRLFVSCG